MGLVTFPDREDSLKTDIRKTNTLRQKTPEFLKLNQQKIPMLPLLLDFQLHHLRGN